ncbi:MAG: phospho-sugar mutase [Acidimicrobiales bacterium]
MTGGAGAGAWPEGLRGRVDDWLADDPDPVTRDELADLVERAGGGGVEASAALADIEDRFAADLAFGTAGLRGALGAGPNRMNLAVVIRAAAGIVAWLGEHGPAEAAQRGVAIGFDARHRSADFAEASAAVCAAAGVRALLLPEPLPTPVLAFAVRHLGAAAGVMVTASHNPAVDNGYKVYDGTGRQIVAPTDRRIALAMAAVDRVATVPRSGDQDPDIVRLGDEVTAAYVEAAAARVGAAGAIACWSSSFSPGHGASARPSADRTGGDPFWPPSGASARPSADRRVDGGEGPAGRWDVRMVYSAMHGVGAATFRRVLAAAGFAPAVEVAEQAEPDPDFPTVAFPNPEEPGALDLGLAVARSSGADVLLVNDPDADRLGVAVPDPASQSGLGVARDTDGAAAWRVLKGDEIGAVLAHHLLRHDAIGPDDVVATTIVSSSLLGKMAAAAGRPFVETLTGFKWLSRAADMWPGAALGFAYEEALGFCVGDLVGDKDGITAAVVFAEAVSTLAAEGRTVLDVLDDLARVHGVHFTAQHSVRVDGADGQARIADVMARLRAAAPTQLGGRPVTAVVDLGEGDASRRLPPSDVIVIHLDGARVVIRPSGTEPKLKTYVEVVAPVGSGETLADVRSRAQRDAEDLRQAIQASFGST